jgi:hypothetical protein
VLPARDDDDDADGGGSGDGDCRWVLPDDFQVGKAFSMRLTLGEKTALLVHSFALKRSFYQDRLGTNIGKTQKKRVPFSCRSDSLRAARRLLSAVCRGRARLRLWAALVRCDGEKNVLFAPFIYKNDHFTKTGSGQT